MATRINNYKRTKKKSSVDKPMTRRPPLETKEELLRYLDKNVRYGFELPFVEEAWDKAVEMYEERSTKPGSAKLKFMYKSPVQCYFQIMGFKRYKAIGLELLAKSGITIESPPDPNDGKTDEEIMMEEEHEARGEKTPVYKNWLINWINTFNDEESSFLKQRFADYYNQYDINDGADKTVLMNILSVEIQLYRINTRVSRGVTINITDIKTLNNQLIALLEAQKWTKKQRSASDDAITNKFTTWLDSMMKAGRFVEKKQVYEEDQIDRLLNSYVQAMREVTM